MFYLTLVQMKKGEKEEGRGEKKKDREKEEGRRTEVEGTRKKGSRGRGRGRKLPAVTARASCALHAHTAPSGLCLCEPHGCNVSPPKSVPLCSLLNKYTEGIKKKDLNTPTSHSDTSATEKEEIWHLSSVAT